MAKGIVAFVVVVAVTMAVSIMAGLGFYSTIGVQYSDSADADVQAAADAMVGQEAADKSGGGVIQDFTTSAARTLSTGWQIIANLGGILQMLFGLPEIVATTLQTFFQITFSITFAAFIRGVVLQ